MSQTQVKAQTTINSTFDGDLESLLRNARDVISMVEKYKAKLARSGEKDEGDMDEVLSTMGLPTLTTRETAGKAYDAQLSQEIYDYSLQRLKERKVIQLADLYITYSRARGADLVGPDEFHKAVMAAEKGRGMKVREFKGVKCVVGSDFSPAAVSKAVEAAAGDAGADAMEVSFGGRGPGEAGSTTPTPSTLTSCCRLPPTFLTGTKPPSTSMLHFARRSWPKR